MPFIMKETTVELVEGSRPDQIDPEAIIKDDVRFGNTRIGLSDHESLLRLHGVIRDG